MKAVFHNHDTCGLSSMFTHTADDACHMAKTSAPIRVKDALPQGRQKQVAHAWELQAHTRLACILTTPLTERALFHFSISVGAKSRPNFAVTAVPLLLRVVIRGVSPRACSTLIPVTASIPGANSALENKRTEARVLWLSYTL